MRRDWILRINLCLWSLVILTVPLALGIWLFGINQKKGQGWSPDHVSFPKYSVGLATKHYRSIGTPLLSLNFAPVPLSLPDLRPFLIYHGINGRPDASPRVAQLHFSLTGTDRTALIEPDKPLYLISKRSRFSNAFHFSPNNKKTSLWLVASLKPFSAEVKVFMVDKDGKAVTTPQDRAQFVLNTQPYTLPQGRIWSLGKWPVDGSLLAKQGVAWHGTDSFIDKHGGKEFAERLGNHRLDFSYDGSFYSVFVKEGNALAWDKGRWKKVKPGPDSQGKPLMVVGKMTKLLMKLELWDPEGKARVYFTVLKRRDPWFPQAIVQDLRFTGALTPSQMLVEDKAQRLLVAPQDWLLSTGKGWKRLGSPKEIDDYVERRLTGPLLVVEKIVRHNGGQALQGYLFNASRSEGKRILLPAQNSEERSNPTWKTPPSPKPSPLENLN